MRLWLEGVNGRKGRFRESLYNCDNEDHGFSKLWRKKVLLMYNFVHRKCAKKRSKFHIPFYLSFTHKVYLVFYKKLSFYTFFPSYFEF